MRIVSAISFIFTNIGGVLWRIQWFIGAVLEGAVRGGEARVAQGASAGGRRRAIGRRGIDRATSSRRPARACQPASTYVNK